MSIVKELVRTYVERLICDNCGHEMKWTGMTLTSYPAQYPHECPHCSLAVRMGSSYPRIVTE